MRSAKGETLDNVFQERCRRIRERHLQQVSGDVRRALRSRRGSVIGPGALRWCQGLSEFPMIAPSGSMRSRAHKILYILQFIGYQRIGHECESGARSHFIVRDNLMGK